MPAWSYPAHLRAADCSSARLDGTSGRAPSAEILAAKLGVLRGDGRRAQFVRRAARAPADVIGRIEQRRDFVPGDHDRNAACRKRPTREREVLCISRSETAIWFVSEQTRGPTHQHSSHLRATQFATRELERALVQVRKNTHALSCVLHVTSSKLPTKHVELPPDGERGRQKIVIRTVEQAVMRQRREPRGQIRTAGKTNHATIRGNHPRGNLEERRLPDAIPPELYA